jgi:hypothetical protein
MSNVLLEKWNPILENDKVAPIVDPYRKKVTAILLENEEAFLKEAASSVAANVQNWDPILISLVRRLAPKLIAYDICGVQPMTGPTGLVFALRAKYAPIDTNDQHATYGKPVLGNEALFDESDSAYSGTGTQAGDDPWDNPFTSGAPKATADGEVDVWNSMSMTIERTSVTAKTRQLRADYSLELAQDLRAIHGLDAENELSNILSAEIIAEINREVVRTIYAIAKVGASWTGIASPGTFDLVNDADGRWFLERVKGLIFAVERDANGIAHETRRGKGNLIITSPDVASALALAGILNYAPALDAQVQLEVDETGPTLAGRAGRFKVYVDPYLGTDGYVVGFKGANAYDAGIFYCPYVPLQMVRATNVDTFQPAIGFKTRYGMIANPFVTSGLSSNQNIYYRKAKVTNLL